MKKRHAVLIILIAWLPMLIAAWDATKPVGSEAIRDGDNDIRANNAAIEAALGANHEFSTGGTNSGKHTTIVMQEQSSITTAANEMGLYCKDLGAAPGLYLRPQSDGTAIQLTGVDAKILSAATDMLDEDAMGSDSATITASQQSIKAFVTSGTITMTNKTLTSPVLNTGISGTAFLDENDMASDSDTKVASQQSIKKYVDDHVGHDGDGYVLRDIDGTPTKVYTKYLTGNLDSDATTAVAHGCTASKILHVSVTAYNSNSTKYNVFDLYGVSSPSNAHVLGYDADYILFGTVGSYLQGQAYRIKIDYYL